MYILTITWPAGLFRCLISFECGAPLYPISPIHVLDVLRESPSIESIRLTGYCNFPPGLKLRPVALRSLVECTLIGVGTTSLIRLMTVPSSTLVTLTEPYFELGAVSRKFEDFSTAPGLHVLDGISTVSFSINDNAVRLQVKNDSGGALDVEVDELCDLSQDTMFLSFILSFFEFGNTRPGFKAAKQLALDVDRGRIWAAPEAANFALLVLALFRSFSDAEEVTLRGVPPMELSFLLRYLCGGPSLRLPCPNIKRLHIETISLRSPRSLLVEMDKLLGERKRAGGALRSLTAKVKCEMLIPTTDHCAFLTSWEGLVEEGVRLEYEQSTVKKLPRCRRHDYDYEDEWDSEDEDDEEKYEEMGAGDPDDSCVGWDGWPDRWPKTMGK